MKTVLVVDASLITLEMAGTALRGAGYRVIDRSRAEGVVSAILQERPDLVLWDLSMAQPSSEAISVALAKADPNRRTLVLLHSNLPPDQLKRKAIEMGAHGWVRKTGSALELVNQVNQWLRQGDTASHGAEPVSMARSPSPPAEVAPRPDGTPTRSSGTVGRAVPQVLFVDDDHFTLSLYRRALKNESMTIDLADTGARALQRILSSSPPDVVVCDLLMPDTDGIRVFEQAVEHDRSWRRRFVFVTGATSVARIGQFVTDDSISVVYKPLDVPLLVRAVRVAALATGASDHAGATRR